MSGRHLREWPRLIAAATVAAVLLVVIGFAVASTSSSSSGTKTVSAKPAAVVQPKPSTSAAQTKQVTLLQSRLRSQSAELTKAHTALTASKARTQCWRGKARHPKKQHAVHCPTGPLTSQ
jgi:hypothetical protein